VIDPKTIAERLGEFVDCASRVVRPPAVEIMRGGWQVQVASFDPGPSYLPRDEALEKCLSKLTGGERDELARMLDVMFEAFGDGTL
jgi:hypothetical protein